MSQGELAEREVAKIFRDWGEIDYVAAIVAVGGATVLVAAIHWLVPRIAAWLPDRFRFRILPIGPVLRLAVLAAAILYVVPLFIVPTAENLLAIGGAMAVALGFAFKDYVSSLIAGIVALYERPYGPGDWVRIDGVYGEVRSLGLRSVEVLTPDDTVVTIPHLKIWTAPIHNDNSGARELLCVADFYLHPDHDGSVVREALHDVALTSPYLHLDRRVAVVAAEEPWGTHYRLKAYPIEAREQFRFVTDLTLRGKELLRARGLRFATPPPLAAAAG